MSIKKLTRQTTPAKKSIKTEQPPASNSRQFFTLATGMDRLVATGVFTLTTGSQLINWIID